MQSTDHALIQRWQQGDPRGFEELVRRWQSPIARFLARYVAQPELVQDLCQEVFLRLYRAGPAYQPRSAFSTWLFQIALNVARDALRRRRPVESLEGNEPARQADPESALSEQELIQAIEQALGELPEPLRLVLVLRHYQGMNFEEMSRLLKTPASTLKSRFAKALGLMRGLLIDWQMEETES